MSTHFGYKPLILPGIIRSLILTTGRCRVKSGKRVQKISAIGSQFALNRTQDYKPAMKRLAPAGVATLAFALGVFAQGTIFLDNSADTINYASRFYRLSTP
jgi:hypothetical protein